MGGVGKTQLAAAIHRSWCAGVGAEGLALWATADSRNAIITAFAEAASAVSNPTDPPVPKNLEAAAIWLLNWLATTNRPWLVVLDDLSDPGDLRNLWPEGPSGACLVTTRRTDNVLGGRGRIVVPVGLFTSEQSHAYLTEKLSILAENAPYALEGAAQLADDLGHLPLALAQAAAYISDRPGETCASYGARLADRRHRLGALFPDDALADDYQLTMSATWSISVESADRLSPGGLARPLLEVASLLDPNGIPIDVLISPPAMMYALTANPGAAPASADAQDCRDSLSNLARHSLISLDPAAEMRAIHVHALVQRATRDHLPDLGRATRAAADAIVSVWREDPHRPDVGRALRDNTKAVMDTAMNHLWQPDGHEVLSRAGDSLLTTGQVLAARDHWTVVARAAEEHLGVDHGDTLNALFNLAIAQGEAGHADTAAAVAAELLPRQSRAKGSDHNDTLTTRQMMARWLGQAGDAVGALAALEELLSDRVQVQGPDHPDTLSTRSYLAGARGEAGNAEVAAAAFAKLLPDMWRVHGPDHPETLTARHNLAEWRGRAGDADGAVAGFAKLLPDRLRVQGPDDPDTLSTRNSLAGWRWETGDAAGAAAAFAELLPALVRIHGSDHPHTLKTRHNLASCRGDAGDPASAAAALLELLRDEVRVLGPRHPLTRTTRSAHANWQAP